MNQPAFTWLPPAPKSGLWPGSAADAERHFEPFSESGPRPGRPGYGLDERPGAPSFCDRGGGSAASTWPRPAGEASRDSPDHGPHPHPAAPTSLTALKEVVLNLPDGVVIFEQTAPDAPERPIVFANPSMARISGYPLDDLVGQDPRLLQGPRTSPVAKAAIRKHLEAGEPFDTDLVNRRKDGGEYVAHLTAFPLRLDGARITHWVVIHRDVTESRRQEQMFQEAQRLDSMGLLAGGIAHDFNNLITAIMGSAMLLECRRAGPEDAELLRTITAAGSRAAELCRELMAYAGKGKVSPQPVMVSDLVQETAHLIHLSISPRAIMVSRLAADLPVVEVDSIQLRQIVMNLVINASDALGDRTGTITLSTRRLHLDRPLPGCRLAGEVPPGDWIEIAVTDTGCGMPLSVQQRLFEPFFTTKRGGHGLGLPAVLGIVRRHRGHILCDSREGEGTTFRILFPAAPPNPAAAAPRPPARPAGLALVVDDDPMIRPLLAALLKQEGYDTVLAADGEEGLRLFTQRAADLSLVTVDHAMPKMDGVQTIAAMRQVASVPTILVTAFHPSEAQRRLAGTDHEQVRFLTKPFTAGELSAALAGIGHIGQS